MKKKILASLLLSTVMVSQVAVLTTAHAETTDDKIAAQDNKISGKSKNMPICFSCLMMHSPLIRQP